MEKIKIVLLCLLLLLPCSTAMAETVYTDSSVDVFADTTQAAAYDLSADADIIAAASPISVTVNSYVYDDGLISSTYLDYARGLVKYVPFTQDYVFARTGQNEYTFACGDFSNGFSGVSNVWKISTSKSSGYTFTYQQDVDFSLSVGHGLIYSNLSPYPSLEGVDFSYAIVFFSAFALSLFGVWSIIRFVPTLFGRKSS